MSLLDTGNIYPNKDFWIDRGFFYIGQFSRWVWNGPKHLHWNISETAIRYGNVRMHIEYHEYSKMLIIKKGGLICDNYDDVYFEPIELYNPNIQEIIMVLEEKYLSSRLYKLE